MRRYTLGRGDVGSTAGVGNTIRMDFQAGRDFADGRIAVSFLGSTTKNIAPPTGQKSPGAGVAVELETTLR